MVDHLLPLGGTDPTQADLVPKSPKSFLDRVSTGSDSDLVSDQHAKLPWFDQVATAPCTDPIQVRFLLLGQSLAFDSVDEF